MQTIQMSGKRSGSDAVVLTVTVQPSVRIQPGVYFGTNEHFESSGSSAGELMQVLKDMWRSAQEHAKTIAETLLHRLIDATVN